MSRRLAALLLVLAFAPAAPPALAAPLSADELLLIVNENEPQGRELAEFYAKARDVPDGRILEVDLPTGDVLPRADYDATLAPAVRKFLDDNALHAKVRCAVTFYGVPLAVAGVTITDADRAERKQVLGESAALLARLRPPVERAERVAADLGYAVPAWSPRVEDGLSHALAHLQAANAFVTASAANLAPGARQMLAGRIYEINQELNQPFEPGGPRPAPAEANALLAQDTPDARRQLRDLFRRGGTLVEYASVLNRQENVLDDDQSDACLDSELATLWLGDVPRARWLGNPLANPATAGGEEAAKVLMVARLDGRDPQQVRDLIAAGVVTQANGLDGKIVVDARGLPSTDAYGIFDQGLRDLAAYLKTNATLPVVLDDAADVIQPPGVNDVAVYVGWYSLNHYVPGLTFKTGAVAYHVASLEMRSIRNDALAGWVRGLLDARVAATLGPVSEPYLSSFPPPERFVPLLLTGRLTLGETYWRTTPMLSWKQGLIGDPLYRPFAAKPALKVDQLDVANRALFGITP